MAAVDAFGYELTTDAAAAVEWDAMVRGFLSHSAETATLLSAALDKDPNFAMAHIVKGYFLLLLGRAELTPTARAAHDAAVARRGDLTARERAYLDGLGLYLAGDLRGAANVLDAALERNRADALLVKLVHAIRFVLGDAAGMRRSIENVISAYGAGHPAGGYVNGCYAFALEETGEYLAAEQRGRDAVAIASDDAWGLHAVAHVFDMTNRCTEGVAWISRQPEAWAHCNNFRYHVWWHLALFHLDRGEHGRVLELYDTEIRADKTDDYRDISNAASLLTRLEFEGVPVGDRWEELIALSERRVEDGCVVFADLHYMLALGAGADEDAARRMLATMQTQARRRAGCMDRVAADAGMPAAAGLAAFASGDYAGAFANLANARPHMQVVGGSHAQRDVFERVTIEAALRAGMLGDAQRILQDRARKRGALDRYAETRLARIAQLRDDADIDIAGAEVAPVAAA